MYLFYNQAIHGLLGQVHGSLLSTVVVTIFYLKDKTYLVPGMLKITFIQFKVITVLSNSKTLRLFFYNHIHTVQYYMLQC